MRNWKNLPLGPKMTVSKGDFIWAVGTRLCGRTSCYRRSSTWTHHADTQTTSLATTTSIRQRVRYKLATLAFWSLSGQVPAYLNDCQLVAESGRWTLRSAERSVCVIQRCNNTFGDRSFAVVGPRAWNDLPATLRNTELTMDTLCKHLKTVLFTNSWGRGAFVTFWYYRAVYRCPYLLTYLITYSLTVEYELCIA